jgi:hypothetical protein
VNTSYAGLDPSRKRLDVRLLDGDGATVAETTAAPHVDGSRIIAEFADETHPAEWALKGEGWRANL